MKDLASLCAKCWAPLTEGSVCAECNFDNDKENETKYLPLKHIIKSRYAVGVMVNQDSDSATYTGYDISFDKTVVIREFLPNGMANRLEGSQELHVRQRYINDFDKLKKSFIKLWTTMQGMQGFASVIPVLDVFEENGTAYAIIEDMDSISLREYLLRNEDGYILWDSARLMFMPVITTLSKLHSYDIVHGSITPDNLVLCRDGKVRLKPFPICEANDASSSMEFNEIEGYTALEQYENNHKISAATDIYAFSCCIYRALVGANPPSAISREANDKLMIPNSIAENIPIHVIKALVSGLQIYPEKRISDIEEFRDLLDAAPAVRANAAPVEDIYQEGATGGYPDYDEHTKSSGDKKRKAVVVVLIILIILAIGAAVYVVQFSGLVNNNKDNTTTTIASKTFQVPNFIGSGYTQADIENNGAWNEQFTFTFVGEYSADTEEGLVFKQSVNAGETVEMGTNIVLTVSKGIQTEYVPDVGGLNIDDATKLLEEKGFKVSSVTVYNDGTHIEDSVKNVYGMAPAAGSLAAVGEEIILQVYGEPEPPTTVDSEA